MLTAALLQGFSVSTLLPLVMSLYFAWYFWCRFRNSGVNMSYVRVESDAKPRVRPVDWFFCFVMLVVGMGFARTFFKF
jgi:hypothetical protein